MTAGQEREDWQDWDLAWFDGSIHQRRMLTWRGVEAQHVAATMRLVDNAAEQQLLEQLLEASKPPMPAAARPRHFLLGTPFRYRPAHASRFRPAHVGGLWYGADSVRTVCAELAYWCQRFIADSAGLAGQVLLTQHSLFQAQIRGRAVNLTSPPWAQARAVWTHKSDYRATHALAAQAQQRAVQWLACESARAPGRRCAVVFDPVSLSEPPAGLEQSMQTWHCKAGHGAVLFTRGSERFDWVF